TAAPLPAGSRSRYPTTDRAFAAWRHFLPPSRRCRNSASRRPARPGRSDDPRRRGGGRRSRTQTLDRVRRYANVGGALVSPTAAFLYVAAWMPLALAGLVLTALPERRPASSSAD